MTFALKMSVGSVEQRFADFSDCGKYRYSLRIVWDIKLPILTVIALNPSVADGKSDDATCRRWKGFARDWGYGGLLIVNLFGLVSTDPRGLLKVADPVGPMNSVSYMKSNIMNAGSQTVWACWGNVPKKLRWRVDQVADEFDKLWCIGVNGDGSPKHCLRQPYTAKLKPWNFSE